MNNPFGPTPASVVQQTANRFPEVEQDSSNSNYYQQQSTPQTSYPYPAPSHQQGSQAPQQYENHQYMQAQAQQQPQQQQQQQFLTPTSTHSFEPQTSFGQQLSAQVTGQQGGGGAYGASNAYSGQYQPYQQQQQQYQGQGGSNAQVPNFLDLDPYAASPSHQQTPSSQTQSQALPTSLSVFQQSISHPRQYVHDARALLMQWDEYAWKQLLSRVDTLREAWEQRKEAVADVSRRGADISQAEGLRRSAESNIDMIHAAKLQLSEVKAGWMHSTDTASKARVREALNAGLAALPEYPPALGPEQVGGSFVQRAQEEYRKQSIMSGFNPQQNQYSPAQAQYQPQLQQQMTGYPMQQQQVIPQQTGYPTSSFGHQQPTYYSPDGYAQQQQQQQQTGQFGGQQRY